jgi:hypothetical protein
VALAAKVWAALTRPTPVPLYDIVRAGTPALAPMAGALRRHLRELPAASNGLSLTEQLALDLLAEDGPMTAQRLFGRLSREREPLPFLGDAMFWPVLAGLAGTARPLIEAPPAPDDHHQGWPGRRLSLTAHGEEVCAAGADRLADGPAPRWVGGVEISPDASVWRWDAAADRPVLTPVSTSIEGRSA